MAKVTIESAEVYDEKFLLNNFSDKKTSPKIKTYWITKQWLRDKKPLKQNMTYPEDYYVEVLKKSDVETFGKSFIKTLTIKIHEVGTGTGSEENVKYKNNDLKDGVMLGIKISAELFQEDFKTKLLGGNFKNNISKRNVSNSSDKNLEVSSNNFKNKIKNSWTTKELLGDKK